VFGKKIKLSRLMLLKKLFIIIIYNTRVIFENLDRVSFYSKKSNIYLFISNDKSRLATAREGVKYTLSE